MSRLFAGPLDDPPLHALEPSTAAASTVCHVRTLTSLLGGLLCNAPRSRRRQALVCCPRNHHLFHFLSYRSVGGCHPERARGTRASEGPAFTGRERRTSSRGTRASEGPAVTVPYWGLISVPRKQVLRLCGAQDDRLARFVLGKEKPPRNRL